MSSPHSNTGAAGILGLQAGEDVNDHKPGRIQPVDATHYEPFRLKECWT